MSKKEPVKIKSPKLTVPQIINYCKNDLGITFDLMDEEKAKEFISNGGSQMELADILGHESLETTRIYTTKSVAEQRETLNKMYKRKNK